MLFPINNRGAAKLLLSATISLCLASAAMAAEKPAKTPDVQPAQAADPFVVPQGTPDELLRYIEKLKRQRPTGDSRQAVTEFRTKLFRTLLKAAEAILAGKPNSQQAKAAVDDKLIALEMLDHTGDPAAAKKLAAFPAELEKAGYKNLVRNARMVLLQSQLQHAVGTSQEDLAKVLGEVKKCLKETPLDENSVDLAMNAAMATEESDYRQLAIDTYNDFGKLLAGSGEKEVASMGVTLQGAARRLGLVGKKLVLSGTTVDGKPLDWSKYKGKIVLIDFWATWCGPCREEMVNIEKNYQAYHDRGFDVLSISVDQDREALDKYLDENKHPWTVLHDDNEAEGTDKSLSTYYGVFALPTLFLVGADGKVVSVRVHGEDLGKELKKLLGPADIKADKKNKDDKKPGPAKLRS